jgi:hypothetical protein
VTMSTIARAAGGLDVLKHVREQGCTWDTSTCYHAARGGLGEILKWLRANGCPWDQETCQVAAFGGHLELQ